MIAVDRVQAEAWPDVRAAAAAKGNSVNIAATAKYLEALLRFAGADCQRTSDATRALTVLLAGASPTSAASRTNRGSSMSVPEASELVSGPLHSLIAALEHPRVSPLERSVSAEVEGSRRSGAEGPGSHIPEGGSAAVASGASEQAELLAAIAMNLHGSRSSLPRRSRDSQLVSSAAQLQGAKPAQVVQAAFAWDLTDSSAPGESQPATSQSGMESVDGFMALARVSSQLQVARFP